MDPRERQVGCHCVLVHLDRTAGGPGPAAFAEVLEDGQGLLVGQSGVLQDGPLALGEGPLAGAAVDQADASGFATPATGVEVFTASDTGLRAIGILTAEVLDGDQDSHPCS
jgi:hypothetical protein